MASFIACPAKALPTFLPKATFSRAQAFWLSPFAWATCSILRSGNYWHPRRCQRCDTSRENGFRDLAPPVRTKPVTVGAAGSRLPTRVTFTAPYLTATFAASDRNAIEPWVPRLPSIPIHRYTRRDFESAIGRQRFEVGTTDFTDRVKEALCFFGLIQAKHEFGKP